MYFCAQKPLRSRVAGTLKILKRSGLLNPVERSENGLLLIGKPAFQVFPVEKKCVVVFWLDYDLTRLVDKTTR